MRLSSRLDPFFPFICSLQDGPESQLFSPQLKLIMLFGFIFLFFHTSLGSDLQVNSSKAIRCSGAPVHMVKINEEGI